MPSKVCYRRQLGKHLRFASISHFDPQQTNVPLMYSLCSDWIVLIRAQGLVSIWMDFDQTPMHAKICLIGKTDTLRAISLSVAEVVIIR